MEAASKQAHFLRAAFIPRLNRQFTVPGRKSGCCCNTLDILKSLSVSGLSALCRLNANDDFSTPHK
jgi:hypothetical protein